MRKKSYSRRSHPHAHESQYISQSHQSKEARIKLSCHNFSYNFSQNSSRDSSENSFKDSSQKNSANFEPLSVEVDIERFADQGRAIAHLDGRVLFIRFALPGEKVQVSVDIPHRSSASFWSGEVIKILDNRSPLRITPPYNLFGSMAEGGGLGGANLCFVTIQGQHEWKKFIIDSQMERLGKITTDVEVIGCENPSEIKDIKELEDRRNQGARKSEGAENQENEKKTADITKTDNIAKATGMAKLQNNILIVDNNIPEIMAFGWRTRVDLIANKDGYPSMLQRASHIHVPLNDLPLASRGVAFIARHFHIWDGGFRPGSRIHISVPQMRGYEYLSDEEYGKKLLESSNFSIFVDDVLVEGKANIEEIVPLYWDGISDKKDEDDVNNKNETQNKNNNVEELRFLVAGNGFWQIHRNAPVYLVAEVLRLLQHIQSSFSFCIEDLKRRGMWDLYSGSGLFTAVLAMWARRIYSAYDTEKTSSLWSGEGLIGIEGAPIAVAHARKNMESLSLGKVRCYEGDVEKTIYRLPEALRNPYVVILDPPRAGAKREVCEQIIRSGARYVIYIACNPTSLARDTATLSEGGYKLESIRAFDIYPMTHHVETVVLMSRSTK